MSATPPAKPASKSTPPTPAALAARLSVPQRVLLFCLATKTDWRRAGIASPTVQLSIVQNLIEHDERTSRLKLNERGRLVLAELLGAG